MNAQQTQVEIKALQGRLMQIDADLLVANNEARAAQQRESVIRRQRTDIQTRIDSLKVEAALEPYVTEHAIFRYFDRVLGFDIDDIKDKIMDEPTKKLIATMKSGKFPREGFKIVVKNGAVVTIETNDLVKESRAKRAKPKPPRYHEVDDGDDD